MGMELKKFIKRFSGLGKVKYALILAMIGICILLVPEKEYECTAPTEVQTDMQGTVVRMEEILSKVEGAGAVRVMVTEKNSGTTEYQTDTQTLLDGERKEQRAETVFGRDEALVIRKSNPEYLGAIIVCEGGDSPQVRLELVKAMCSLTGLASDKISVLKMKK